MKTDILILLIKVTVLLITWLVLPFLKTKFDTARTERLMKVVKIAVESSEQLFSVEQWKEKKEAAKQYLNERGYDADKLENEIEAAVLEVKKEYRV